MNYQVSRRSLIAASMSGLAIAGMANHAGAYLQTVGSESGHWESTEYGDIVTWDDSRMFIHENLSGPGQNFAGEWDKVTLGLDPEISIGLAIVRFEEL